MHASLLFLLMFAIYAVVLSLGAWFTIGPVRRQQFRQLFQVSAARTIFLCSGILLAPPRLAVRGGGRLLHSCNALAARAAQHKRRAAMVALLISLPALFAFVFVDRNALEAYKELPAPTDPVIAALLHGEQLVPPSTLPPEVFVTRELNAERQDLADADRQWPALRPEFRQRLLALYTLMEARGYRMVLLEGYRSPQRQAALARLGPQVTNAGAYQSYHQYGLAADSAFYRNGRIVISAEDPWAMKGYRLYGQYAQSLGLVWGGDWRMRDFGHVELHVPGVMAKK
jgi:peptidoglycan L-alanyl-D-glutamate endopeptidase CwlK